MGSSSVGGATLQRSSGYAFRERSALPKWGSSRFRPPVPRTCDAPPVGRTSDGLTKSRKTPTRKTLPPSFVITSRVTAWVDPATRPRGASRQRTSDPATDGTRLMGARHAAASIGSSAPFMPRMASAAVPPSCRGWHRHQRPLHAADGIGTSALARGTRVGATLQLRAAPGKPHARRPERHTPLAASAPAGRRCGAVPRTAGRCASAAYRTAEHSA